MSCKVVEGVYEAMFQNFQALKTCLVLGFDDKKPFGYRVSHNGYSLMICLGYTSYPVHLTLDTIELMPYKRKFLKL